MCSDAEIRRECEKKSIDLHYETFCAASKEIGLEVKFSREQVRKIVTLMANGSNFRLFLANFNR